MVSRRAFRLRGVLAPGESLVSTLVSSARTLVYRCYPWLAAGLDVHAADVYLTDEVFLYRVVDVLATGVGEMAELEDCYRLDIVRAPISDVLARRLRVVTPA